MDTTGLSRVRPTASKRRRRRGEFSSTIIFEIENAPQIEEGEGDEESEGLTAPFPRGPTTLHCWRVLKLI